MAAHAAGRYGCRVTTHHDLARAARGRAAADPGRGRRGPGHGPARGLPGPAGPLHEARLPGDDRGGRLAVLRPLLPALLGAARPRRPLLPAVDRHRRPALRAREGGPQLLQHPDLPGRLPALGGGDSALRRPRDRHEHRLAGGDRGPLRPHARALARALHGQLGPGRRARLRRAVPAPLDALAGDERGGLQGAADSRRADLFAKPEYSSSLSPDRWPSETARRS